MWWVVRLCLVSMSTLLTRYCGAHGHAFGCRSTGHTYISDAEVHRYCRDFQTSYQYGVEIHPDLDDLTEVVQEYALAVLHSKVAILHSRNVTWTSLVEHNDGSVGPEKCTITARMYYVELDNYCIFKNLEDRGSMSPLSARTLVYSQCPFAGLDESQELVVISDAIAQNRLPRPDPRQPQIALTYLYAATEDLLSHVSQICPMHRASVPLDAPQDNKHQCPIVPVHTCGACTHWNTFTATWIASIAMLNIFSMLK